MKAVAQLDKEGADVVVDGLEYLAVVIDLLGVLVVAFLALGYGVYQEGDVFSEALADVFQRVISIFHNVVEEGGDDGVGVQLKLFCGNVGNGDGVDDIGLARIALLALVGLGGEGVCVLDAQKILRRNPFGAHVKDVLCGLVYLLHVFHHLTQRTEAANECLSARPEYTVSYS